MSNHLEEGALKRTMDNAALQAKARAGCNAIDAMLDRIRGKATTLPPVPMPKAIPHARTHEATHAPAPAQATSFGAEGQRHADASAQPRRARAHKKQ